ncbi:MAG TPA: hypothetical protein VIL86_01010, partial [Tepidisphaeraceae bacterium]
MQTARVLSLAGCALGALTSAVPAALQTSQVNVPNPAKVNLVFNRDATLDSGEMSGWSTAGTVFRPSTAKFDQATPTSTGQKYAITIGQAYSVGGLEFVFGRYNLAYIPATFSLYAAPDAGTALFTAGTKIADETTAGLIFSNTGQTDSGPTFTYQQLRYNLPSAQTVYKFGIQVNSWQQVGTGTSDNRAFMLAATANPSGVVSFDGHIGVFDNTWNPGGTIAASDTLGGNITLTPVYDTNDWSDPRWYGRYDPTSSGTKLLTVTEHLADTYNLDGVRWAAGQTNAPKTYQVFAANYDGAGNPPSNAWVAVTGVRTVVSGNYGDLVSFDTPYVGNWVRIDATDGGTTIWENTKWQTYGTVVVPEPAAG